jgi:hypothetical protein
MIAVRRVVEEKPSYRTQLTGRVEVMAHTSH